eukprot:TRINITY_DN23173_c3_g1_i1.p1 TRINITY_DN23173_c3_g1~~TRINITY_DN23173_c3_g1_i1.p1  ORF type:complete len:920 (-),score=227.94 TRINITY_DN23173_c3_g1_i1:44-2803(-)
MGPTQVARSTAGAMLLPRLALPCAGGGRGSSTVAALRCLLRGRSDIAAGGGCLAPAAAAAAASTRWGSVPLRPIRPPALLLPPGQFDAPAPFAGSGDRRWISGGARKRLRKFRQAKANPDTHPGTLHRLREKAAMPNDNLMRYISEQRIGKPNTTAERRRVWFDMRFKRYAPQFMGQIKPLMRLWTTALEESQLPLARLPEVALAGRSNSGKSTLVNYLCGQHSANVRRTPGSTTELVFWQIGKPARLCLVDLPGYGFAYASDERRLQWTEFTLWYVRSRKNLRLVLLLIDARFGLKPADKEMIAFLERSAVKWQIVVTKCDKVVAKDLARKLTVLNEDLKGYMRMESAPIPISSLKKQGMEKLRAALEKYKVTTDVLHEGISRRIYDLLEIRRLRRAEKARRKREAKRQAEEARKAAEEEAARADAETQATEAASEEAFAAAGASGSKVDLHAELQDAPFARPGAWGDGKHAARAAAAAAAEGTSTGDAAASAQAPAASSASSSSVPPAHYALDDRDSARVAGFARELFPDLSDLRDASSSVLESSSSKLPEAAAPEVFARSGLPRTSTQEVFEATTTRSWQWPVEEATTGADVAESDSDSDSDDGEDTSIDNVNITRFDVPLPQAGIFRRPGRRDGGGGGDGSGAHAESEGLFPGFSAQPSAFGASPLRPEHRRSLRRGASSGQDKVYDQDDFASPAERAAGLRGRAPPAPTMATHGRLLSDARERYEREWAMELENVDEMRRAVPGAKGGASEGFGFDDEAPSAAKAKATAAHRGGRRRGGEEDAILVPRQLDGRPAYIGRRGLAPLARGRAGRSLVGRQPAKVLKAVRQMDAAKAFNQPRDRKQRRRRNFGSNLSFEEAQDKWMSWYKRTKKKDPDLVLESESPKRQDVDAAHEEYLRRRERARHGAREARRQGE